MAKNVRTTAGATKVGPVRLGYKLSCEERSPTELVRYAGQAEDSGFSFGLISDFTRGSTDRARARCGA